jgi:hypothetical protein
MGQKDIAEASFIELNDVFADIFNVLIYKGKRVIKEKELLSMPRKSQYKSDSDKLHEQERDVLKKWRGRDVELAILGVENQTLPDKDMPFRIINYDGVSYRSQIKKKSKKRYPVITIVLYFGENQAWNYSPHLTDYFNTNLPEDDALWEYISDYKINVFDIGALTDEELSLFQSDFREIATHFVKVRRGGEYIPSKRTIKHVDEFLKLMKVLTGDERYSEIKEELCMKKGDDVSMCTVIDTFEKRGIVIGIQTGIERGIKRGVQQELTALVRDGIISKEIASQRLEMSLEEFEKLLATK